MSKKKVKRYPEEFRREAVSLADQPGKTAREIADSLGIHVNQIYNWRLQFKRLDNKQFHLHEGVDYSKEELAEIRQLKREIETLKKERDFLKKATAYFSNQHK
jgi:transposase